MEKLQLSKPIQINGEEVNEIPYDFEGMTGRDKMKAGRQAKLDGVPVTVEELDSDYHLYIFAVAVTVAAPSIDISDVLRISAKDAGKAARKARDFFYRGSEE